MGVSKNIIFTILAIVGTIILLESFTGAPEVKPKMISPNCDSKLVSKPGITKSHFFGLNCMSCHVEGRKGKGCFTIAGSVLDEDRSKIFPNAVVKLYTEPRGKGKLVATIKTDKSGNFY